MCAHRDTNSYDAFPAPFAPPPPFSPALYHYGYNDAGYRGSQVYPALTQRSTCPCQTTSASSDARVEFRQLFLEANDDAELSSSTSSSVSFRPGCFSMGCCWCQICSQVMKYNQKFIHNCQDHLLALLISGAATICGLKVTYLWIRRYTAP